MPTDLQVIRAAEFIRVGPTGAFDLESSRKLLAEMAAGLRRRGVDAALLDARSAHTNLTPDELAGLVVEFGTLGFARNQRLAVLHNSDQNYRARLFALIGNLRGWTIKAFEDFEAAMTWLAMEEPAGQPSETPADVHSIPIRIGKVEKPRESSP
jgi:hypothetical protein